MSLRHLIACVCLSGMLAAGTAQAGSVVPFSAADTVSAYGVHEYLIEFQAGEVGEILLIGDGSTDLDLYLISADGRTVVSDSLSDIEAVQFRALTTGYYTVQVHNFGPVWNAYQLTTN